MKITGTMATIKNIRKDWARFMNETVRIRSMRYKGIGRPRQDDFDTIKREQIQEYHAADMLNNAFSTHYTN